VICTTCGSTELEFVESHADDSVVGGIVRKWICVDCGKLNEDVPVEVHDEASDKKMTDPD
jgi:DNA-directed RNA polymerase subunit RPC12/RpoP